MRFHFSSIYLGLMLAFSSSAVLAAATLSEVVITGQAENDSYGQPEKTMIGRSALPLAETPVVAQTISAAMIEDQQSERLGDVLRNVSGVQSMFYLGGAYERFVVRGFEQSLTTYRNGVQMPFQRFQSASTERVEILKGPASAQYGMSDPGGIINIVTKEPSAKPAHYLGQRIGANDHYRTEAGATGALNADGSLTYRVDASATNTHSFREVVDNRDYFVAPSLRWQVSPATRLNFSAEINKARENYDQGVLAYGKGFLDVPRKRYYGQEGMYDDHENTLIDLNAEHKLDDHWKISGGYLYHDNRKEYRSVYAYANLQPGGSPNADRMAWFGPEHFTTQTLWTHLAGEVRTGAITHHLLAGVQLSRQRGRASATDQYIDTINVFTYRPTQSNINTALSNTWADVFLSNQDDKASGIFIQDQIVLTERFNLMAALRHDRITRELASAYYSPVARDKRSDSKWSPRIGGLYKLTPTLSAFASYSESFGPAFIYEPSELYKPEESKQYEMGLKAELFDGRLQGSVALFDLTKSNIQTPSPTNPSLTVAIGEARSRGLEIDLQGRIAQGWDLIASYANTDTKITKDYSGNEGNELPNAPRHQGSLWLKYTFQDEALRGLSLGGGLYAASKRQGDAANSYADGGFTRFDLAATYRFKTNGQTVTARLNLENVTDEKYYTMRSRWSNMPATPRTLVASLRTDF